MPTPRRNVLANLVGRGWNALLSILVVPPLVRMLGTDCYGLIGFFAALAVVFTFLDMGLSIAVNREIAIRKEGQGGQKTLLRTFEAIYWPISFLIATSMLVGADSIARWVHSGSLSHEQVRSATSVMAVSFALQWPVALYAGVLRGLQEQVKQNVIFVLGVTLRTAGGLFIVAFVDRDVHSYLVWQAVANFVEVMVAALAAWRLLGSIDKSSTKIDLSTVRRVWRYALSFNVSGVLLMLIAQGDRLVMGWSLGLKQIAYYSIAATAVGCVSMITWSVSIAMFPRFAELHASEKKNELSAAFHHASQFNSFFVAGAVAVLFFFPDSILLTWTRSSEVAANGTSLLRVLAIAGLLNGLWNAPYTMINAAGRTRYPLIVNICAMTLAVPAWLLAIPRFGATAAAMTWLIVNLAYWIAYHAGVHQILAEKRSHHIIRDDLQYVICAAGAAGLGRAIVKAITPSLWIHLAGMTAALLLYAAIVSILSSRTRSFPGSPRQWAGIVRAIRPSV